MSEYIPYDMRTCLEHLITNLEDEYKDYSSDLLSKDLIYSESEEKNQEIQLQIEKMIASHKYNINKLLDLTNAKGNVNEFCKSIEDKRSYFIKNSSFMNKMDVEYFAEIILQSTSFDIQRFRTTILMMYSITENYLNSSLTYVQFTFPSDLSNLNKLKGCLENGIASAKIDNIQRLQVNGFIKDLESLISQYRY